MRFLKTALLTELSIASNIVFQLFDDKFLFGNYILYYIAYGYHTDDFVIIYDREMTNMFLCHQGHTFCNGLRCFDANDIASHNFGNQCSGCRFSLEENFSSVISF